MSAEEVAQAFVRHYYGTLDQGQDLSTLYRDTSCLSFEGAGFQGAARIVEKLRSLGPVAHNPTSVDVQPSITDQAMLIFVSGQVRIGGDNPVLFTEMFQLVSTGPGTFYVQNQIHRLVYAA
mmetsp:Transcript_18079/g.61436  ORF Transcript_18079/g.61436 Transcript_18079/m.61436 type:complete len:121 (-) Transcript_18079:69-431(-)